MMTKVKFTLLLIYSVALSFAPIKALATDEWGKYFQAQNGDVYFFDTSRVKTTATLHEVWSRIQYSRSVMGASSYQSLLEIDCTARVQRILQSTFFSDKNWEKPAMNTNTKAKPKRPIKKGTASEHLFEILCSQ